MGPAPHSQAYKEVEKGFWTAGNLRDGIAKLTGKDNAFKMIAEDGIRAAQHHEGRLTDQIPLHEWITVSLYRSVDSIASRLQGGLAVLATTGSTAPFIGLFGTVWGIYNALIAISLAGQASIDKTAGPIGEALIMTAIGLFVAVPAVMGYNWLLRRNKDIIEKLRYFAADLHSYLVSGARVDSGATAPRAAARQRRRRRGPQVNASLKLEPHTNECLCRLRMHRASTEDERAMSEINTTPLVDVMLVLLIVFMITIPVITQTVPLELPTSRTSRPDQAGEHQHLRQQRRSGVLESGAGCRQRTRCCERLKALRSRSLSPKCTCAPTRARATRTSGA